MSAKYTCSPTLKTRQGIAALFSFHFIDKTDLTAKNYFEEALKIDPFCRDALEEFAHYCDVEEKYAEAELCYELSLRLSPNINSYLGIARVLDQVDRQADALEYLEEGIATFTEHVQRLQKAKNEINDRHEKKRIAKSIDANTG